MADELLTDLPSLPTPLAAGDALYVARAGVDYQADGATDIMTPAAADATTKANAAQAAAIAASVPTSYLDTDGTLAANSDVKVATQKATKTYADTKQAALGFTPENVANKDIDGTLAANSDTKYASQKATKTYADTKTTAAAALAAALAIKLDDFAATDDNTDLDATTFKHGLFPKLDKVKLDGIEALADVTDAANVASSIHGAAGKTTPVDADELGLLDSAAAFAMKVLTWANVKATLKTYFDTLYATAASIANMVTAAAVLGNTKLVVGDGARGVAESALTASLVKMTSGVPAAADAVTNALLSTASKTGIISVSKGDGSAAVATGIISYIPRVPFACTIVGWAVSAQGTSPNVTLDIFRAATGGTALASASIVGAGTKPVLNSGNVTANTAPASWTSVALALNDTLGFNLDTNVGSAATAVQLQLFYTRD